MTALIHYLLKAGESVDSPAFVRELAERVPQHGDALITIAQQLKQKGIEKGKREATLKIARSLLQIGMSHESVMETTSLTEDEPAQIRH